jgi:hypothetical protein
LLCVFATFLLKFAQHGGSAGDSGAHAAHRLATSAVELTARQRCDTSRQSRNGERRALFTISKPRRALAKPQSDSLKPFGCNFMPEKTGIAMRALFENGGGRTAVVLHQRC